MVRIIQSLLKKYGNDTKIIKTEGSSVVSTNYFPAQALFWNTDCTFCTLLNDKDTFFNVLFPKNILKIKQIEIKTRADVGYLSALEIYSTGNSESFAKILNTNKPMCPGKNSNNNCIETTIVPFQLPRQTYTNGIKIKGIGTSSCDNTQLCITAIELIGDIIQNRTCFCKRKSGNIPLITMIVLLNHF